MTDYEIMQSAFVIIERLAGLCATTGIDEDTKKQANSLIQHLLSGVLKDNVTKIGAVSSGLVV